jgi:hypothetical protein
MKANCIATPLNTAIHPINVADGRECNEQRSGGSACAGIDRRLAVLEQVAGIVRIAAYRASKKRGSEASEMTFNILGREIMRATYMFLRCGNRNARS